MAENATKSEEVSPETLAWWLAHTLAGLEASTFLSQRDLLNTYNPDREFLVVGIDDNGSKFLETVTPAPGEPTPAQAYAASPTGQRAGCNEGDGPNVPAPRKVESRQARGAVSALRIGGKTGKDWSLFGNWVRQSALFLSPHQNLSLQGWRGEWLAGKGRRQSRCRPAQRGGLSGCAAIAPAPRADCCLIFPCFGTAH
jgi:hypothetical protein